MSGTGAVRELVGRFAAVPRRRLTALALVAAFTSCLVFYLLFISDASRSWDIHAHARFTRELCEGRRWPPAHFLLFGLAAVGSCCSSDETVIASVIAAVLSAAVAVKLLVAWRMLDSLPGAATGLNWRYNLLPACALIAAFSILISRRFAYLGQVPPTVWHNSTSVLAAPLVLWLFDRSWRFLDGGGTWAELRGVLVTALLLTAAKPNYLLAWAPVFCAFSLAGFGFSRTLSRVVVTMVVMVCVLAVQYAYAFVLGIGMNEGPSSLAFSVAGVWLSYARHGIPASLAASFAFPAAFLACYGRDVRRPRLFAFTLCILAVAMALFVFVEETGPRRPAGNFFWQVPPAAFCLFLVCLGELVRIANEGGWRRVKWGLCASLFGLHVLSGLAYLAKCLLGGYR